MQYSCDCHHKPGRRTRTIRSAITANHIVEWLRPKTPQTRRHMEGHEIAFACVSMALLILGVSSLFFKPADVLGGGGRKLVFPEGANVGLVFARPSSEPSDGKWVSAKEGWQYLGEARGRIEVPAHTDLMIRVRQRDLSFLQPMGFDAFSMLDCSGVGLTDEDTVYLKYATELRALNLSQNPALSDRCLAHLASHGKMTWLNVDQTGISGGLVSANALARMEDLLYFSANDTHFEDKGMAHLGECAKLKVLLLANSQLSISGVRFLSGFVQLEVLNLEGSPVEAGAVDCLLGLPRLRHLNLSGIRISDRDLLGLPNLHELQYLNLDRTRITDGSLPIILECERLQLVTVRETGITLAAISENPLGRVPRIIHARSEHQTTRHLAAIEG
ncbi:MAG: hypothetical protein K1Y02_01555 [Candidatus Hydrogenedentes bacterium]|nr:hypothetical protein [Candidatus Hydrogenedentota bacterium]